MKKIIKFLKIIVGIVYFIYFIDALTIDSNVMTVLNIQVNKILYLLITLCASVVIFFSAFKK